MLRYLEEYVETFNKEMFYDDNQDYIITDSYNSCINCPHYDVCNPEKGGPPYGMCYYYTVLVEEDN